MLLLVLALCAMANPPEAATPMEQGRAIYVARCQACHGPEGKGDGPAVRALGKAPADPSDPTFWKTNDLTVVRSVIADGKPGTPMRGFPMPSERQDALMAYLQSLAAPAAP